MSSSPPQLAKEIINTIESGLYDACSIGRENIIWGAKIKYTDWGPEDDRHIWLYKKGAGKWVSDVHEEYRTDKKIGFLKNYLVHKNYETVNEFICKIDRYSEIACNQKSFYPRWWFIRDFLKRYFYKMGFLDGYRGLFLSYLQSIYFITLTVKEHSTHS